MVRLIEPSELELVRDELARERVVAVPTDTVYGLAALAARPAGLRALFALKGRPDGVALPVLVAGLDQARPLVRADAAFERLAETFWPGPLTIVTERAAGIDYALGGDGSTIGLRCPASALVRELCESLGPLAVTSANLHGERPCTSPAEIEAAFSGVELYCVDGGECAGEVSSVVVLRGGTLEMLRAGAIAEAALRSALDRPRTTPPPVSP